MKITADTNVLVRASLMDHAVQGRIAADALLQAECFVVTLVSLCEFAWVLTRGYRRNTTEVAAAIRKLIDASTILVDRPAADAGLAVLEKGGDFADGVIAFEGRRVGANVFTSFDKRAVELIEATGGEAWLLSAG
ncbi:MAG TPA: type II toxin-antitoxin system VapC family toxin [Xanthobacteraceae bacterium]